MSVLDYVPLPTVVVVVTPLFIYISRTLSSRSRKTELGWRTLGASLVAFVILVSVDLALAPSVFQSLRGSGNVQTHLVLNALTFFGSVPLIVYLFGTSRSVVLYLAECYHPTDEPRPVRILRGILKINR